MFPFVLIFAGVGTYLWAKQQTHVAHEAQKAVKPTSATGTVSIQGTDAPARKPAYTDIVDPLDCISGKL
jgi:hypothetical protein